MLPKQRVVTFPVMGRKNSEVIKSFLESLNLNVVLPPPITDNTVKLGVKYSADMVCFTKDTLITTENFISKYINKLKEGDLVLTHKGRFKRVDKVVERDYEGEILNVNCGGTFKFKITTNHEVLAIKKEKIRERDFIPEFIKIKDLKKSDHIAIPVPKDKHNKNSLIWDKEYNYSTFKYKNKLFKYTPELLRILGYWLAEGSVIYNKNINSGNRTTAGLSFVFSSKEKEYIEEVKKTLNENFNCSISERFGNERKMAIEILVYSKSLADIFLYLCNEKCDKKTIHKDLLFLEPELQLEIVKGFFRGDGHFNPEKKDKRYSLATVSPNLASQIFWILIRNNIKPEIGKRIPKNKKTVYFLRLWKGYINKLELAKFKDTRLTSRKIIKTENHIFVPIKEIRKEAFKGKVYNLAVEEDNSYVANFMAVHNCYPFKVTLGNYIEALENGANTLLSYDTKGRCRFRQYSKLHDFTLKSLGYDFEMHVISSSNLIPILRTLSGKSYYKVIRNLFKYYHKMKKTDKKSQLWSKEKPNIGIIGEIFSCCDEKVNYDLEAKIRGFGGNPYNTATTSDFMRDQIGIFRMFNWKKDTLKSYKKQAENYFNGPIGGHAFENIYNLLYLVDKKVDGVVHIEPLTCAPEVMIEPYVRSICQDAKIPLLKVTVDENNSEANLETRLETFLELIKIRGN